MLKAFAYGLMFLILVGSLGVPVYQHTCLHEKKTIHTVFVVSDHCESKHEEITHQEKKVASCCAKKISVSNEEHADGDNCCVDEVGNWHFSCFSNDEIPVPFLDFYLAPKSPQIVFCAETTTLTSSLSKTNLGKDPPPKNLRTRLAHHCIWRI